RLDEEIERALSFERPLALAAVSLRAARARGVVEEAADAALRRGDVLGAGDDGWLFALLPALDRDEAAEAAARPVGARAAGAWAGWRGRGGRGWPRAPTRVATSTRCSPPRALPRRARPRARWPTRWRTSTASNSVSARCSWPTPRCARCTSFCGAWRRASC